MTGQKDSYSFGNNANVLYLFINEENALASIYIIVDKECSAGTILYFMYAGFDMRSMSRLWMDITSEVTPYYNTHKWILFS